MAVYISQGNIFHCIENQGKVTKDKKIKNRYHSYKKSVNKNNKIDTQEPVFGVLGCGRLACRIAQRLVNVNFVTKIFDKDSHEPITNGKIKNFAESVDIILSCYDVPDQMYLDICREAINHLAAGKGFVQMSVIINAEYSVDFNELCNQKGIKYLEAIHMPDYSNLSKANTIISRGNNKLYKECRKCFNDLTLQRVYCQNEVDGNGFKMGTIVSFRSLTKMMTLLETLYTILKTKIDLHQTFRNTPDFLSMLIEPEAQYGTTLGELMYHANLYQQTNGPEFGNSIFPKSVMLIEIVNRYNLKNEDLSYLYRNIENFL